MKRLSFPILLSLSALLSLSHLPKNAEALPFVDLGPKVGYGLGVFTGLDDDADLSVDLWSLGLAATVDLVMVQLEANLLYLNATTNTAEIPGVTEGNKATSSFFAVPVIGRVDISPIPMFKLAFGGGYERRFAMGDDADGAELNYLPLSLRTDIKVPLVGSAGLEGRFNYQLGDEDVKTHEFMIYIHATL